MVLYGEAIHDARIISLDRRPHLPSDQRRWNGDSVGHYEGNTLVVDTTNFSPNSRFMGAADNLHLVERFTRASPDAIDYEITLDDSTTWTRPWTALIHLRHTSEFACHEGSGDVIAGILAGARAEERAADEAAKRPKY